ncbi:MAG: hypothetical protein M1389_09235 [Chloroflexi bacterium]|nr:hypothetical protein [Chloroflexota bacterium]
MNRGKVFTRLNPFATERQVLFTQLTPAECSERLAARTFRAGIIDIYEALFSAERYPIYGSVSERGFTLGRLVSLRYPIDGWLHADMLHIKARGRFISRGSGTSLPVSISFHPVAVFLVLIIWGFGVGLVVLAIQRLLPAFVPVGFFVLWGGAYILFLLQSRDVDKFLLNFLRETLEAKEMEQHWRSSR